MKNNFYLLPTISLANNDLDWLFTRVFFLSIKIDENVIQSMNARRVCVG